MEWNPALLELRGELEARFLGALRADVEPHADVGSALDSLLVEPVHGTGLSHFLRGEGQLREYAALRSLYHLKEADPEVWAIPRLTGCAKAGLVAVEYDGYGAGRADRIHAKLFADLMADLGLDNRYGSYLESGTAEMLAVVNLMSALGLHRSLRGALVGHYATVEVTSSPSCRRLAGRWNGSARDRPPCAFIPSMWRQTRCTSSWSGARSSGGCWLMSRSWNPTCRSAGLQGRHESGQHPPRRHLPVGAE